MKMFSMKKKLPISSLVSIVISILILCLYVFLEIMKIPNTSGIGFVSGFLGGVIPGLPVVSLLLLWLAYKLYTKK